MPTGNRPALRKGAVSAALLGLACGCAPRQFVDGVAWEIQQSGTTHAAWQCVKGYPCLRMNAFLLDRLARVETLADADEARSVLMDVLGAAQDGARQAANNEIDRLPDAFVERLWRRYYPDESVPNEARQALRSRFWQRAMERFDRLSAEVRAASDVEQVHRLARQLHRSVRPSPKDRHGGGPFLALVSASIKEDRGPLDRGGPLIDLYSPNESMLVAGDHAGREQRLLARYAPVIVQERLDAPDYPADTDQIGAIRLVGNQRDYRVVVDASEPTVYGYWQHTWIHGARHLQLTYTHWFPRHAKLKPVDPEAGNIEGATLRITLDSDDRPLVFETVLNCGCYHRCYPVADLESAACSEYGGPLEGKHFCIEQIVAGKMDWIIPETVLAPIGDTGRPIVFSRAGYHGIAGVERGSDPTADRTVLHRYTYDLRPYETLERLPIGGGYGSMFAANGLVRGAQRLEGAFLAPTGMLSAGQPRQRGTQLLHWDQYDFDDPHLLERCLRLPRELEDRMNP